MPHLEEQREWGMGKEADKEKRLGKTGFPSVEKKSAWSMASVTRLLMASDMQR